jgi:hypothetical protein
LNSDPDRLQLAELGPIDHGRSSTLTSRSICSRADIQKIKLPSVFREFHQRRERS